MQSLHTFGCSLDTSARDTPRTIEFAVGQLVIVRAEAGRRLGGKQGVVLGAGATSTRVRIRLNGSKGPITLHRRFLTPFE